MKLCVNLHNYEEVKSFVKEVTSETKDPVLIILSVMESYIILSKAMFLVSAQ